MIKLMIQIPCYNEEETLPVTLSHLPRDVLGIDVCPAKAGVFGGRRPTIVKGQSPVAWMAGVRETDHLKPIDKALRSWGQAYCKAQW